MYIAMNRFKVIKGQEMTSRSSLEVTQLTSDKIEGLRRVRLCVAPSTTMARLCVAHDLGERVGFARPGRIRRPSARRIKRPEITRPLFIGHQMFNVVQSLRPQ